MTTDSPKKQAINMVLPGLPIGYRLGDLKHSRALTSSYHTRCIRCRVNPVYKKNSLKICPDCVQDDLATIAKPESMDIA